MDFAEFKKSRVRSVFAGLGRDWPDLLRQAEDFEDLRASIRNKNIRPIGSFATAVRRYATTCSCGEHKLLLAVCALVDFGHLSDELARGRAWQDMTMGCDQEYRAAIAACVMAAP